MYCSLQRAIDPIATRESLPLTREMRRLFDLSVEFDDATRGLEHRVRLVFGPTRCPTEAILALNTCATARLAPERREIVAVAPSTDGSSETSRYLECAAIALAARVLTAEQVAEARHTNELLRRCRQSVCREMAGSLARSFHLYLVDACPNAHMVALFHSQTFDSTDHGSKLPMTPDGITRAADDHDEILCMIERQAPTKSIERFLSRHVAESTGCCIAG